MPWGDVMKYRHTMETVTVSLHSIQIAVIQWYCEPFDESLLRHVQKNSLDFAEAGMVLLIWEVSLFFLDQIMFSLTQVKDGGNITDKDIHGYIL